MIKLENINHTYSNKSISYKALYDVNIEIPNNKFVVILGQSGSGKTTLLNIIAGLLKPTSGRVIYNNIDIYKLSNNNLCNFRNKNIGFVFQNFFLESCFSARENVMIPLFLLRKKSKKEIDALAIESLKRVGLENKISNKPAELSGGECQRVAIARALVNKPSLIIADEPTGNLDSINGLMVIEQLKEEVKNGKTVIMVTHNEEYKKYADIVINIKDGKII